MFTLSIILAANSGFIVVIYFKVLKDREDEQSFHNFVDTAKLSAFIFGVQHLAFALQYLRSSLTVPLYFLRQEKIEANCLRSLMKINKKIRRRKYVIIALQILLTVVMTCEIYFTFDDKERTVYGFQVLLLYLITLTSLLLSTWLINRWKRRDLVPLGYKKSCKYEGFFATLTSLVCSTFIIDIFLFTKLNKNNFEYIYPIFMVLSFLTTMFIKIFMIKMSRARWSNLAEEDSNDKITHMDREVAAEWFD